MSEAQSTEQSIRDPEAFVSLQVDDDQNLTILVHVKPDAPMANPAVFMAHFLASQMDRLVELASVEHTRYMESLTVQEAPACFVPKGVILAADGKPATAEQLVGIEPAPVLSLGSIAGETLVQQ